MSALLWLIVQLHKVCLVNNHSTIDCRLISRSVVLYFSTIAPCRVKNWFKDLTNNADLKPWWLRRDESRRSLLAKSNLDVQTLAYLISWNLWTPYAGLAAYGVWFGVWQHMEFGFITCWRGKVNCCHQAWFVRRGNTLQSMMWKCPSVPIAKDKLY